MIETRRLEKCEEDEPYFRIAEEWVEAEPEWLKALDRIEGVEPADLWEQADNPENVIVGLWNDGEYRALFSFHHTGGGAFEGHLVSKRGVRAEEVQGEIWRWGWGLFSEVNAHCLYAWIPELNRVSRVLNNTLSVTFDGVIRWHGIYRGKIMKWRRHTLYRATWESWQTDGKTYQTTGNEAVHDRDSGAARDQLSAG